LTRNHGDIVGIQVNGLLDLLVGLRELILVGVCLGHVGMGLG